MSLPVVMIFVSFLFCKATSWEKKKANNFVFLVFITNALGTLKQLFSWPARSGYRELKEEIMQGGQHTV